VARPRDGTGGLAGGVSDAVVSDAASSGGVSDALRRRRMVRSFTTDPVPAGVLDRILEAGRRAPSAGHTQAVEHLVLEGPEQTGRYWEVTLPAPRRPAFRWSGLLRAPVLVMVYVRPDAYARRYAEPDKAATGLGSGPADWPVPYWHVDAGMAVMAMLLTVVDEGLGALFFGQFDHADALREAFGVPPGFDAVGTIALGHPAPDEPGRSAARPRRGITEVVHRGVW
jgi:nitroreductase